MFIFQFINKQFIDLSCSRGPCTEISDFGFLVLTWPVAPLARSTLKNLGSIFYCTDLALSQASAVCKLLGFSTTRCLIVRPFNIKVFIL